VFTADRGKEVIMAGPDCCRYEPSLDELIDDEVMAPVLRSAGFDAQGFREMIVETARRIGGGHGERSRTENSGAACRDRCAAH
jgi:hypothetical protein